MGLDGDSFVVGWLLLDWCCLCLEACQCLGSDFLGGLGGGIGPFLEIYTPLFTTATWAERTHLHM